MHLAPEEPGSEKLLAESREEAFRRVKRRLYRISNSSHCVGASQSPGKPKGACQSLPSLWDFSVSPRTLKQRGNGFTVAQYQRNWTRTGLVQNLRQERRKRWKTFPFGRWGKAGTSKINLTGKGRKVRQYPFCHPLIP